MAEPGSALPEQLSILIVDDEADALFLLQQQLRRAGHTTFTASSAAQARVQLQQYPPDLLISAIHLPDDSGLDLLRWVRQQGRPCEVILVTATPQVDTAIQALRDGAADYLAKPIAPDTLTQALERVRQRLRQARERPLSAHASALRPALPATAELPARDKQFQVGPVLLDLDRFMVAVNGRRVDATPSELEILHYLCRHPNRVVTAQELVQSLRGYQVDPRQAPEIIRPHISNLRRKLLAAAVEADVVKTVRGVGYMLKAPREA